MLEIKWLLSVLIWFIQITVLIFEMKDINGVILEPLNSISDSFDISLSPWVHDTFENIVFDIWDDELSIYFDLLMSFGIVA